jgi:hypothetical protein
MDYRRALTEGRRGRVLRRRIGVQALPLLLLLLPLLIPTSAPAQPLDCAKLFTPASSSRFPFAWRENRCEGFVQQKTSFQPMSIKISYFGYGNLDHDAARVIANNTDGEIELRGELKSSNTFYRLVARLAPGQSIEWRYPDPLKEEYGHRPDKIGMLAAIPGAKANVHRPFTVSGSTALSLGIVSSDFRFNSAEVVMYDGEHTELCRKTYDFGRVIAPLVQHTFALNLCGKDFATVRRISVVAALKILGKAGQTSSRDVIWIQ